MTGFRRTIVNGITTFIDGQHTGALPGGLVRNQYVWKDGVRGTKHTDAVFDDPVRLEILANVSDLPRSSSISAPFYTIFALFIPISTLFYSVFPGIVQVSNVLGGDGEETSMDAALDRTMSENATGARSEK